MTIIDTFKSFLIKRKLKHIIGEKKRVLQLIEFDKVRSVALVFDASIENKYKRAAHLVGFLKAQKKEVSAIGYVASKELPHFVDTNLTYNYLLKKDVSWYDFSNVNFVNDFIKKEFDLLIDLNFDNIAVLHNITKSSLAHCKIGLNQGNNTDVFDFMLEGIQPDDINLFLKELIKYLELIRTK